MRAPGNGLTCGQRTCAVVDARCWYHLWSRKGDGVTQTDIREQRSSGPTREGEKICHIVEHDDPDRALCGKDVTGYPWNPPWPICVVCVDLYEQSRSR